MGSFFNLHRQITQTPKARATRGVGNMLSEKILKSWCSETSFLMFWEDKLCLKCSILVPIFMFTTLHTSTPISGVHYGTRNYRRLMLRYQKDKNGWETTEKCQRIVLKKDWLNKENIIFLWLGRVSKTGRILCEKERPEIFAENRRFPAKMGGLVSPWNFVARSFSLEISLHFICFSEITHTPLKSQMAGPLWPLFTSLCNQIGKWLKKPGRRAYSVSRASKDLSSESWCKTQWKTGFYILV